MVTASTFSSFASDFAVWSIVMYIIAILSISLCIAAIFTLCFEMPFTRVEKLLVGRLLGTLMGSSKPVTRPTVSEPITTKEVQNKDDLDKKELVEEKDASNLTTIQDITPTDNQLEENNSEKPPVYIDVTDQK